MFDMNVTGFVLRTVSITYTTTVGNWAAEIILTTIYLIEETLKDFRSVADKIGCPNNNCNVLLCLPSASVMILPEADHVNTSIWPGVSKIT